MACSRLPPLPTVKDILRLYNIRAQRKLSQNFIMDPRLLDRVALAGGPLEGLNVVEVGPGPGGITRSIIGQGAARCAVIEKDLRFLPSLQLLNDACRGKLDFHMGDVLSFNMEKLFEDSYRKDWLDTPPDIRVIGNLPFNVSTPLIIRWLAAMSDKSSIFSFGRVPLVLTFQHEVALRMVTPHANPNRSRLSVMCQNWASVKYLFKIPGGAFVPKPEVDVGVVLFTPLTIPYIDLPFRLVEKVVTMVLHGKKKTVKSTVGKLFPYALRSRLTEMMLLESRIKPNIRPVDLTMEDFNHLCHSYNHLIMENPSLSKFNQFSGKDETLKEPAVYLETGEPYLERMSLVGHNLVTGG
jgi:dimethyladenosine transferase 1